jgi:serine/threonine-protein kinase
MFVYNVYSTCLAYRRTVAAVTLVCSILPPLALGTAIAAGWMDDPGIIRVAEPLGGVGEGVVVAAFVVFLVLTYVQGRRSREVLVASLADRDAAVRTASHREALFLEARQDLERALQAGGMGRFSEQTLGSFRLGRVLGRGGMGEVYEALNKETGEPAAVKMLLPEVIGRPGYVRRFLREVKIAASLESRHVVRVLEVGDESSPMPYLAMERLEGEDLSAILRREERLSPGEVVDMVRQVGRGITAAAAAGIVHRDLKPQNLFRTPGAPPTWKILDFGISKLVDSGDTLTQREMVGTPGYMAPEQARGAAVDVRTDLYALAAITYRALTGHPPFRGEGSAAVLVEVMEKMPRRPSSVAALSPAVDEVLALALAKSPEDRFATATAFADALEAALAGKIRAKLHVRAAAVLAKHPWSASTSP